MDRDLVEFIEGLIAEVPSLAAAATTCQDEWAPEEPPVTTLFAALGSALVDNLGKMPTETRCRVFARVEAGMRGPSETLGAAVATGLVEAMVTATDNDPTLWHIVEELSGAATLKHAVAWRDFGK